jgi:hypothetical protein
VTGKPDWTRSPQAEQTFGDEGPWIRHLQLAWHAANLPAGVAIPLPPDPTEAMTRYKATGAGDLDRLHADVLAYWTPLLHLLCFGLGWSRPDLGLARWVERGAPTDDPILCLVARWWGPERVNDFLAWASVTDTIVKLGRQIADTGGYRRFDDQPLPDRYRPQRQTPSWQAVWAGDCDPLHLSGHCVSPMTYPTGAQADSFNPVPHWANSQSEHDPAEVPRMVVLTDTYRAWHALLWHYRPQQAPSGRSIRTDVVCKPIGWLGEYRFSRETGAWFRGRHRWHHLGH